MTLDAFEAFTKDRSHLEKWELIDGEAIMQASPKTRHQQIVTNILFELEQIRRRIEADWIVVGGIGARVADDNHNEIIPDVMILPQVGDDMSNWTFDLLVAFEVLSPGSVRRDMVRKPTIYRRMPALMHYFVVAQDQREVTVFARAEGFVRRTLSGAVLQVDELGIAVSIAEIYRGIRLG
jgi:Uma2 family endonuclease